jgi:riboflavin synthase
MFNGIIKNTGTINKIVKKNANCILEVSSKLKFNKKEIGSSISCSGACLTLENYNKKISQFYISKETINKTIFKLLKKGDIINFEKSLIFGDRLSGHFVQGHVDTTSIVKKIYIQGSSWVITFFLHRKFKKYIVTKGSIAINGVSLTISKLSYQGFQVTVIPTTLSLTNLINLKKNDVVNVEFDVLGKYIKKNFK